MKKRNLFTTIICALVIAVSMSSCIGSFNLTNKVLGWNKSIGNKFVNELVFIAFWIVPVYEVTALADVLVVNSIEFWSGTNPVVASTSIIPTDHGDYIVECDGKGYTVTHSSTGESMRLEFTQEDQTWSVVKDGESYPLMTFIDESHVEMPLPDGTKARYSIDELGVLAYRNDAQEKSLMAGL